MLPTDPWPTGRSTRRSVWRSPTRAPSCTSAAPPSTPTTWSAAPGTACTPGRSRPRTRTPGSPRMDVEPAYAVPGVVRVLTAADVPGVNDAGVKHDEPLFPDEVMFYGHAVCWVLGETEDAARDGAAAIEVDYEPLPSLITVEEAIAAESFQGNQRTVARGDAEAGLAAAAHRFSGEFELRGPGALLPGDQRRPGHGGRERPDLRPVQHPAPVGDPGDRRPRARPERARRDRAVPADGRRVRRQGDAAARLRRRRGPGRDPHRTPGAAAAEPDAGHHHDRQAAPVPRQLGGRLRRRLPDPRAAGHPDQRRRLEPGPVRAGAGPGAVPHRQRLLGAGHPRARPDRQDQQDARRPRSAASAGRRA